MHEILKREKPIIISGSFRPPRKIKPIWASLTFVILALIFWTGWRVHQLHRVRTWPAIDLSNLGLKFLLKTDYADGSYRYLFRARPDDKDAGHFNSVLQDGLEPEFYIALADSNGFELCSEPVQYHKEVGTNGTYAGLKGSGPFKLCGENQYASAASWQVRFVYPALGDVKDVAAQPLSLTVKGTSRLVAPTDPSQLISDVVTGADFTTGEIDTLSGAIFIVSRDAERMTLLHWEPKDSVSISCKATSCLITNENGQSVHTVRRK
jgi:hypothetical protein